MLWARAAAISLLATGTVAAQRGRVPQLPFMKSSTSSAVVFGSMVAGLSSGTGGGFTLDHSWVMSLAFAGAAPTSARITKPKMLEKQRMMVLSPDRAAMKRHRAPGARLRRQPTCLPRFGNGLVHPRHLTAWR